MHREAVGSAGLHLFQELDPRTKGTRYGLVFPRGPGETQPQVAFHIRRNFARAFPWGRPHASGILPSKATSATYRAFPTIAADGVRADFQFWAMNQPLEGLVMRRPFGPERERAFINSGKGVRSGEFPVCAVKSGDDPQFAIGIAENAGRALLNLSEIEAPEVRRLRLALESSAGL
jgi:hypothetical protein